MKHNLLWLWIVLAVLGVIGIILLCLPKSKKRYLNYLMHFVSSLVARYFV